MSRVFCILLIFAGTLAPAAPDPTGCAYHFGKIVEAIQNPHVFLRWEWLDRFGYWLRSQRHAKTTTRALVRLGDLTPNHRLEIAEARQKTSDRGQRLHMIRDHVLRNGKITMEDMDGIMPSSLPMSVVRDKFGNLIVMEGCGRLGALQAAFGDHPETLVEVEYMDHGGDRVLTRYLEKILKANGTRPAPPALIPPVYSATVP